MTTSVVTVDRLTSYKDIVRLLAQHRISGVPVLSMGRHVVGVVTEGDLLTEEDKTARDRMANPGRFLRLSGAMLPWLGATGGILTAIGLVWGLFFAPADWQQGDAVRIMYVHVPAAWLASAGYLGLAVCSALSFVWRHPLADLAAVEIGPGTAR